MIAIQVNTSLSEKENDFQRNFILKNCKNPRLDLIKLGTIYKIISSSSPKKYPKFLCFSSPRMHPNLFPAYFIFFIISVHVHTSLCAENEQYLNCSTPVQCANMEISYPFWGGNRPGYCGHPGFELSCDGDAPEFTMVEVSYRVRDINNASQTLTVARADFWNDYCPQKYINTTLNVTLFSYSTRYPRLTLYYGCPPSIQGLPHAFICSSGTTNITGYLATNDTTLVTCNNSVTVPVSQSAADAIENSNGSSIGLLTAALNNGFGLVWAANYSLCQRCVASGGQCGYKSSTNEFTCYCRDKPYASTCQKKGMRNTNFILTLIYFFNSM